MSDMVEKGQSNQNPLMPVSDLESVLEQDEQTQRFLTFHIDDVVYGVNIEGIREILEFHTVTAIPMAPKFIRGVLNLRGSVVPIIDLAVRLGKEPAEDTNRTCIIVVEVKDEDESIEIGFIVDSVDEVLGLNEEDIEPSPSFGVDIRTDFIDGMGRKNEDFVVLLGLETVFSIEELSQFGVSMKDLVTAE
jgi:purine-binding chemotaxis protein CheW